MARQCDVKGCGGTEDVQKIVLQVVSGESCQCHGEFCKSCRDTLPGKMQTLGFSIAGEPVRPAKPVATAKG